MDSSRTSVLDNMGALFALLKMMMTGGVNVNVTLSSCFDRNGETVLVSDRMLLRSEFETVFDLSSEEWRIRTLIDMTDSISRNMIEAKEFALSIVNQPHQRDSAEEADALKKLHCFVARMIVFGACCAIRIGGSDWIEDSRDLIVPYKETRDAVTELPIHLATNLVISVASQISENMMEANRAARAVERAMKENQR